MYEYVRKVLGPKWLIGVELEYNEAGAILWIFAESSKYIKSGTLQLTLNVTKWLGSNIHVNAAMASQSLGRIITGSLAR
jgi:hypothetical protein